MRLCGAKGDFLVDCLENRIRDVGREIYTQAIAGTPSIFDKKRWDGKVLEWAMKNEDFKLKLFRFIDVLPSLKSDNSVIRILKEYFTDESIDLLGILKVGVKNIPDRGLMAKAAVKGIRTNIRIMARQFIAGSNPQEAGRILQDLRESNYAMSIYLPGELVVSDKEAGDYTRRYLDLLDTLHSLFETWPHNTMLDNDNRGYIPRLNISVKLSSLYSQLDPVDREGSIENTKINLRAILRKAKKLRAFLNLDMEAYYCKDIFISIYKSILEEEEFKEYPHTGIAIQSYLIESEADLHELIRWSRDNRKVITIRLVKGAYWDYEKAINKQKGWPVPVFLFKEETDLNFERLTRILLENGEFIRPAVATHNIRSIANTIACAEEIGLYKEAFEFQMLYGMAEPVRDALKNMGYRVRVYTPVGELIPSMAYLVRRLIENTSNESFLKRFFVDKIPFEDLIKPPEQIIKTSERPPFDKRFRNEPLIDFSKKYNRGRMIEAIIKVKSGLNEKYPLLIGGDKVWTDKEIISVNPSRPGEVVGRVSSATIDDADKAVRTARIIQDKWRIIAPHERAGYLLKVSELMRQERFNLAALEVFEVGKTWKEADSNVTEAIDYLNYYALEIMRHGIRRIDDYPGEVNDYLYEPKGIGVVISPWNFPLAIPAGMVSAAIVTGNCVIFKPSGLSPVIGYRLVELFNAAGLPEGVIQYLPGPGGEIGEYLVTHPDIDFIAFTGSREVGLRLIELAGKTLHGQRSVKRVIAEMGGKNAIIIDETADLDDAVKGVLESAFGFQGQKCSACSRVIVLEDIYKEFCERFEEAVRSIKIGPPEDPENFMGPVIDDKAMEKIQGYIESGEKEGMPLLVRKVNEDGYYIGPAIFEISDINSTIAREEVFGPVVIILKAEDIESALKIANSTCYALTGGIYSRSPANIKRARMNFRVGNLYINRKITGALVERQPFGGFGMSGVGSKAGGPDYLLQFMNPVCISENTLRKGFAPNI